MDERGQEKPLIRCFVRGRPAQVWALENTPVAGRLLP